MGAHLRAIMIRFGVVLVAMVGQLGAVSGQGCSGDWLLAPGVLPDDGGTLRDIHGTSPNDLWAVGHRRDLYNGFSSDDHTLALHWNGTSWSHIPTPTPGVYVGGGTDATLYAVEAIQQDDVWAVGTYYTQHNAGGGWLGFQILALHWDGLSWEVDPTPHTPYGGTGAALYDIETFGPDLLWAVGYRVYPEGTNATSVGVAMRRDGTAWTEHLMPILDSYQQLKAMSALAPDDIWAVGGYGNTLSAGNPLVVRWNGASWSQAAAPPTIGWYEDINDILALASDDVFVVGQRGLSGASEPTVFRWDGSGWTEETVDFPYNSGRFDSIAGTSGDLWAFGTFAAPGTNYARPLVAHRTGNTWQVVPNGFPAAGSGSLWGGFALGTCQVHAVGQASQDVLPIQRLDGAPVTMVRGDCAANGGSNIADVVFLLRYLFPVDIDGDGIPDPSTLPCPAACDGNDDGAISLPDAVVILGSLFGDTPLILPEPSVCAEDPTPDTLGCPSFSACP